MPTSAAEPSKRVTETRAQTARFHARLFGHAAYAGTNPPPRWGSTRRPTVNPGFRCASSGAKPCDGPSGPGFCRRWRCARLPTVAARQHQGPHRSHQSPLRHNTLRVGRFHQTVSHCECDGCSGFSRDVPVPFIRTHKPHSTRCKSRTRLFLRNGAQRLTRNVVHRWAILMRPSGASDARVPLMRCGGHFVRSSTPHPFLWEGGGTRRQSGQSGNAAFNSERPRSC